MKSADLLDRFMRAAKAAVVAELCWLRTHRPDATSKENAMTDEMDVSELQHAGKIAKIFSADDQ